MILLSFMEDALGAVVFALIIAVISALVFVVKKAMLRASGLSVYQDDLDYFGNPEKRKVKFDSKNGEESFQIEYEMSPFQISKFRRKISGVKNRSKEQLLKVAKEIVSENEVEEDIAGEFQIVNFDRMSIALPLKWIVREKKTFTDDSLIVCVNDYGEYFTLTRLNKSYGSPQECLLGYLNDNLSIISKKGAYYMGGVQSGDFKGNKCAYCGFCFREKKKEHFGYVLAIVTDNKQEFVFNALCNDDWSKLCSKDYLHVRDSIEV